MNTLSLHHSFESIKHIQGDLEFWLARELMPLLWYKTRQKFEEALSRAMQSCESSGNPVKEHFLPAPVKTPSLLGWRPQKDYLLTRYACYLIAQNKLHRVIHRHTAAELIISSH